MQAPRLYADSPARRTGQVLADVAALVAAYATVRAARVVHDAVSLLAVPARRLEDAGVDLRGGLESAADAVEGLPLVGDALRSPLDTAAEGAGSLAGAGRSQQEAVDSLATVLSTLTVALPLVLLVVLWLLPRLHFVRRATAAQRFVDSDADLELFALRAMSRQPFHRLAAVSDDPVGAWRAGDAETVRRLASLELRSAGLRPPPGR